ncbi:MAG: DUF935 family protein, partial [Armatimonadetes bacterium]|nr:DUF935 family protein [Candidatus Hippobium faecium]
YSLAKVHLDLLGDCLSGIRRDMEETVMNEQVIKPLADLNFGTGRYPKFTISHTEGDMLKKNSEALADIINLGIADPKEYWIRDFLGIPENKED